ncbi:hypothetical protein CALVIDRAFT_542349 [Calocera viscosa TUFC12733]|uniref:Uncharacterized protein n=1 Tax=Calocera viscosa (strain TUFC12733) TaxID=1330018 RepID=A0A167GQ68_CALVF|nr:hypothetical protein CALVIDRAFT_542349 [Calocera viscosa TUFC12733]
MGMGKLQLRPLLAVSGILVTLLSAGLTLLYLLRSSLSSPPTAAGYLPHLSTLNEFEPPGCPSSSSTPADTGCPFDPYQSPGMIYWGKGANDTRWVPFPLSVEAFEPGLGLAELGALANAQGSGLTEGEMDALGAGERLMLAMVLGGGEWARGRNVLFLGDSHDRNNVYHFCDAVGGKYTSWGDHTGGWCGVERLDLTLAVWFLCAFSLTVLSSQDQVQMLTTSRC